MKKEDLCMLLVVVALVLIISRNTKLFEGMENAGGSSITETIEDMFGLDSEPSPVESDMNSNSNSNRPTPMPPTPPTPPTPPRQAMPPTPTPPRQAMPPTPSAPRPAMPPTPPTPSAPRPAMPPTPSAPRQAMPPTAPSPPMPPTAPSPPMPPTAPSPPMPPTAQPPRQPAQPPRQPAQPPRQPVQPPRQPVQPSSQGEPTPFGTPLSDNLNGAFGQGFVGAFDNEVETFASATHEENYGEKIPVSMQQEYLTMKSLGTLTPQIMQNVDQQRSQGAVMGSEFKPFDPSSTSGSLLDQQFAGLQTGPQQQPQQPSRPAMPPQQPSRPATPPTPPVGGGGGGPVEVHMVYGSWCGHSKRAMPDFEQLVSETGVTTGSGSPVKFVMTEDTSDGMKQFEGKVRGFPTYMVVKSDGSMDELTGHARTKESIIQAVKSL